MHHDFWTIRVTDLFIVIPGDIDNGMAMDVGGSNVASHMVWPMSVCRRTQKNVLWDSEETCAARWITQSHCFGSF